MIPCDLICTKLMKFDSQVQCDQIGQFIGLWATIQSWWPQLFCPNCPHCKAIFCKSVKIIHFSSEIIFEQLL